jgi:hypothetical protein
MTLTSLALLENQVSCQSLRAIVSLSELLYNDVIKTPKGDLASAFDATRTPASLSLMLSRYHTFSRSLTPLKEKGCIGI